MLPACIVHPLGDLCKRLAGFSLYLPKLRNRSDFRLLCCAMLATISPQHSLSSNAVEALKGIAAIDNLSDLDWSVRTLAIQHHEGVIRTEGVTRILGQRQLDVAACSGCKGHMVKEVSRARRQSRYARARPALRGAAKKERHDNDSDRPEDLEDIDLRPSPLRTHLAREPTPRRIAARVSQAARRVRALVYSYLWLSGRRWRWLISSRR